MIHGGLVLAFCKIYFWALVNWFTNNALYCWISFMKFHIGLLWGMDLMISEILGSLSMGFLGYAHQIIFSFECKTHLKFSEMINTISFFFLWEYMFASSVCMHFKRVVIMNLGMYVFWYWSLFSSFYCQESTWSISNKISHLRSNLVIKNHSIHKLKK